MSTQHNLTQGIPLQITNGQQGAHLTPVSGLIEFADSPDSPIWDPVRYSTLAFIGIRPPEVVYIRARTKSAAVVVTVWDVPEKAEQVAPDADQNFNSGD